MRNNEKVLLALVAGLAMGAVMGVLLAPHKGSKTRRMIREHGNKIVEDLFEKVDEGKQGFNTLKKEVIHAIKEVVG